jgi:hypothetical protein
MRSPRTLPQLYSNSSVSNDIYTRPPDPDLQCLKSYYVCDQIQRTRLAQAGIDRQGLSSGGWHAYSEP